jgi:hypothetical protein
MILDKSPVPNVWMRADPSPLKPEIDYNQGNDERLGKLPSLQGGACLALSIFWVQYSKRGVGLVEWLKPPKAACSKGISTLSYEITHGGEGLQVVMNAQKKLVAAVLGGSGDEATKQVTFQQGILRWAGKQCVTTDGILQYQLAASISTLSGYIEARTGYRIFGFWIKGLGGHACAASTTNTHVTYFDPNWGVYKVHKTHFKGWLTKKFSERYAQIVDSGGVIDV